MGLGRWEASMADRNEAGRLGEGMLRWTGQGGQWRIRGGPWVVVVSGCALACIVLHLL